jgi:hypothetical protein
MHIFARVGRFLSPARGRALPRLLLAAALLAGATLAAQGRGFGYGEGAAAPLREGLPERRAGFTFCRLLYTSVRSEAGGLGWSTDYPGSDINFMIRLSQFTTTHISQWRDGEPGHAVVRPMDTALFSCPFVIMSDAGTLGLSEEEVGRMREYLLKGGFLWADDFWGERAWAQFAGQIQRVLPEYPIVEMTPEHPLFASYYTVKRVPQVPSIQHWRRSGGETSERGYESAQTHMRGIFDERGRLLVLMTHNTDISDGWEREGEDDEFFYLFSPEAYAVGLNVAIWTMTH